MKTATASKPAKVAKKRTRLFRSSWGDVLAEFVGICPITGTRLYINTDQKGGNDPRGPLGRHAVHDFIAGEYGMQGPTLSVSWVAVNDNSALYERALAMAKAKWREFDRNDHGNRINPDADKLHEGEMVVSDRFRRADGKLIPFPFKPCKGDTEYTVSPNGNGVLVQLCFPRGMIS